MHLEDTCFAASKQGWEVDAAPMQAGMHTRPARSGKPGAEFIAQALCKGSVSHNLPGIDANQSHKMLCQGISTSPKVRAPSTPHVDM